MNRTHHCNELGLANVGQRVSLCGWVNSSRNLGGMLFIDLRDREGITQLVIDPATAPAVAEAAKPIREEWVLQVGGVVQARPENMVNAKRATGAIEVAVDELKVLNQAAPMPYNLDDPAEFAAFARGEAREIRIHGTEKTVTYDPQKRIGVTISKIGASKAISIGAYDFALDQLDRTR